MPAASSSCVQICGTPGAAAPKIGIEEIVHPGAIPGTMRSLDPEMIEWTCVPCSVAAAPCEPRGRGYRGEIDWAIEDRDDNVAPTLGQRPKSIQTG